MAAASNPPPITAKVRNRPVQGIQPTRLISLRFIRRRSISMQTIAIAIQAAPQ